MTQIKKVAVVGAGIGGLMSALALNRHGVEVALFERDAPPPEGIAPEDSMAWLRRGVPQSHHPHFFMGRLRVLLETEHPELMESLLTAGAGENGLTDYVHPDLAHRINPRVTDINLRSLNCRRTTFEMTVRDYVSNLDGITVHNTLKIDGLEFAPGDSIPRVSGICADGEIFNADVVIDASGRFSNLSDALREKGVRLDEDQRDSGLIYLTRHYRLNEGCEFPSAFGLPGAQFPEFTLGALPADNGYFTVTFQVYRDDPALTRALRDPDHFQWVCTQVNQVAPWVEPDRAQPVSKVFGFGQMDSFWRKTVSGNTPGVLNFFFMGDACVRSNPKYGRGCTWSSLAAHELAGILAEDLTPAERIIRYEERLEHLFRRDWLTMRNIDRSTENAFATAMGTRNPSLLERLAQKFQVFFNSAIISEPALFRDVWTGYHGLAEMSDWSRNPANWGRLARAWLTRGRHADLYESQRGRPDHATLVSPRVT